MRRVFLFAVVSVVVAFSAPSRAQFCPGVSPWVFDDVQASDPFCGYITWMAQNGITLGCGIIDANHRLYCPTANVSRSQMAAFMNRLGDGTVFKRGGNAFGATAVLGTTDGNELDVIVNNAMALRLQPGGGTSPNVIGGHSNNAAVAFGNGQTVGGGGMTGSNCYNPITGTNTKTCGNIANADFATVGGGLANTAGGGVAATVGGGQSNNSSSNWSTVAGGYGNRASAPWSAVLGGHDNTASAFSSAVLGGSGNRASGVGSVAAGDRANADQTFCFVFGGWSNFPSAGPNCLGTSSVVRFMADHGFSVDYSAARADGGGTRWVYIGDAIPNGNTITTWSGAALTDAGVWANASDRALKEGFRAIDPREVLEGVIALPVTRWRYRTEADEVSHIGPTAQDFHATFALGISDKTIGTVDSEGVALAAIQGLNAKLEAQIAERDAQIAELRRMVEVLMARASIEGRVAAK